MKKLTATLLSLILLTQIVSVVSAKPKGDWNAVKALVNRSVAVKARNSDTRFGLLQFADDAVIKVQLAGKNDFASQEITLRRDEVEKIWRAKLRFDERNIAKGAWIGAGAGLGAAFLSALVLYEKGSADPPVGIGAFPMYGAGIGALVGAFWKKKHKKQALVYSV